MCSHSSVCVVWHVQCWCSNTGHHTICISLRMWRFTFMRAPRVRVRPPARSVHLDRPQHVGGWRLLSTCCNKSDDCRAVLVAGGWFQAQVQGVAPSVIIYLCCVQTLLVSLVQTGLWAGTTSAHQASAKQTGLTSQLGASNERWQSRAGFPGLF